MEMNPDFPYAYPIINLSKEGLQEPGSASWIDTCKNVRHAFEEHGFFVAVQDEISSELSTAAFQELEKLFSLPKDIKARNTSKNFEYFGYQVPNPMLCPESMGIEDSTNLASIHNFANLIWPSGNDNFCEVLHSYAKKASELDQMVAKMIFESYGLDKIHYESHKESLTYIFRMMKYLPPDSNQEGELGAAAHTDKNFVTILHQNQVNALQIKSKHGNEWVLVDLPPCSLAVFAGDALSAWSNGRIHAVIHRVMRRGKVTRYSIAQFSFVTKRLIQVPEELVDEEHPLQFKPFDNFELLRFYASPEGRYVENLLKAYCGV